MALRRVWTRQHQNILRQLEQDGRYIVKRQYIEQENQDTAPVFLEVYRWYAEQAARYVAKPADVDYPVWLSLKQSASLLPAENTVTLTLELPEALIILLDMELWSMVLNYAYIPADTADLASHQARMAAYGLSDAQAYMSRFYPQLKGEIRESWQRLFQGLTWEETSTGTIWEIRREWLVAVDH